MRAGLAASGPGLVLRLFSHLRGYGFGLQPTGAARAVAERTYHSVNAGASTPKLRRVWQLAACKDTSLQAVRHAQPQSCITHSRCTAK